MWGEKNTEDSEKNGEELLEEWRRDEERGRKFERDLNIRSAKASDQKSAQFDIELPSPVRFFSQNNIKELPKWGTSNPGESDRHRSTAQSGDWGMHYDRQSVKRDLDESESVARCSAKARLVHLPKSNRPLGAARFCASSITYLQMSKVVKQTWGTCQLVQRQIRQYNRQKSERCSATLKNSCISSGVKSPYVDLLPVAKADR